MDILVRCQAAILADNLLNQDGMEPQIPPPTKYGRRVRIKTPKGVVHGDWNGYYDMREIGGPLNHSVGYDDGQGGWSHGFLHQGDEILDPVPSFDEWNAERKARDKKPFNAA